PDGVSIPFYPRSRFALSLAFARPLRYRPGKAAPDARNLEKLSPVRSEGAGDPRYAGRERGGNWLERNVGQPRNYSRDLPRNFIHLNHIARSQPYPWSA